MKRCFLVIIFMGIFNFFIQADENIRFFWSFGDIGYSLDNLVNKFEPFPFINVGNINWITKHGFGWGFHVFNIEGSKDWHQSLLLPIEINYSPVRSDSKYLFLTFYGRGGWMIRFDNDSEKPFSERNDLFGAVGLRAAWFPKVGDYWSIFTGAFIEYTSKNELRIGASLDTSVVIALGTIVYGIASAISGNEKDKKDEADRKKRERLKPVPSGVCYEPQSGL
jgi:hypothetical protein